MKIHKIKHRNQRLLLLPLLGLLLPLTHGVVGGGEACQSAEDCSLALPHCVGKICMLCREDSDCPTNKRCLFIGALTQCIDKTAQPGEQTPDTSTPDDKAIDNKATQDTSKTEETPPDDTAPQEARQDTGQTPDKGTVLDGSEPNPESRQDTNPTKCQTGETRDCYNGPAGTARRGECKEGKEACIDGEWAGRCVGAVLPSQEICDTKDNNCDGNIDDGCDCIPNATQDCYSGSAGTQGVGICKEGKQTCNQSGRWGSCVGEVTPQSETCDGRDNNCNGQTDESNPGGGISCDSGNKGECTAGQLTCTRGRLICAALNVPKAETCDRKDNDCDGSIDESNPGGGAACDSGQKGECKAATQRCTVGRITCVANKKATKEVCDGKDNDCDGSIDESNPGGGGSCSTTKLGECKPGIITCISGKQVCFTLYIPKPEVCDGKDNDCDGKVDDNIPPQTCHEINQSFCYPGKTKCTNGKTACTRESSPLRCTSDASCAPCGTGTTCIVVFLTTKFCRKP